MKRKIKKIIRQAKESIREMLKSVYSYNSLFVKTKEQEKLLERILFAMSVIDRKFFIEENSYLDTALSIGEGQTISQPSTVARMLLLAELQEGDNVLEIGTGSGWNASLIAFLVYPGNVVSIERFTSLKEKAEENIKNLKINLKKEKTEKLNNIRFYAENIFSRKNAWKKKYDKIIITAGIFSEEQERDIENLATNLLKEGGMLICPRTSGPLLIIRKKVKLAKENTKEEYVFVPLLEH